MNTSFEILPPVEIGDKQEVVGITIDYNKKTIRITRHTQPKECPARFEPDDFTSITFSATQLLWLKHRLPTVEFIDNYKLEK